MTYLKEDNIGFLRKQAKRRITLNEYVKAYYDADIIPFDTGLLDILQQAITRTFDITKTAYGDAEHPLHYREGGRINEYGNHVENVLCAAIEEITGVEAKNLGVGYPDVRTAISGYTIYPECKITKDLDEVSGMRSFYTTTPAERTKKIKNLQDGMHLLFKFEHAGPGVLTGRFRVWDLNGLEYTAEGSLQQGNDKDVSKCKLIMESV